MFYPSYFPFDAGTTNLRNKLREIKNDLRSNAEFGGDVNYFESTYPATNISADKDRILIEIAAPGYSREDFDITVDKGNLTVISEKDVTSNKNYNYQEFKYKKFKKIWNLDNSVNHEDVTANYNAGILSIEIPFVKEKVVLKKIEVR